MPAWPLTPRPGMTDTLRDPRAAPVRQPRDQAARLCGHGGFGAGRRAILGAEGHFGAPRDRLGVGGSDGRDLSERVLDSRAPPVGILEPDSPFGDFHPGNIADRRAARPPAPGRSASLLYDLDLL